MTVAIHFISVDQSVRIERYTSEKDVTPSGIKTVREVAREIINEAAQAARDQFRKSVRPVYGATESGRPNHLGSAILLRLAEGPFMLTAAHNFDWNETTSLYLGVRRAELLELNATMTSPPGLDRDSDVYDFAFARLPEPLAAELGPENFVEEMLISRSVADSVGRSYTCLGYPNSKNRTPRYFDKSISPVIATYTSNGIAMDRLGPLYGSESHILIDFDFRYSHDENGTRVSSIKPNGFSGGAVIDLGRLSDPEKLPERPNPKLIGLFIEAHRSDRAIAATRIAPALAEIRRRGMLG